MTKPWFMLYRLSAMSFTIERGPTEREQLVLRRRMAGDSYAGIGIVLGLGHQRVRQIYATASQKVLRLEDEPQESLSAEERTLLAKFGPRLRS